MQICGLIWVLMGAGPEHELPNHRELLPVVPMLLLESLLLTLQQKPFGHQISSANQRGSDGWEQGGGGQ